MSRSWPAITTGRPGTTYSALNSSLVRSSRRGTSPTRRMFVPFSLLFDGSVPFAFVCSLALQARFELAGVTGLVYLRSASNSQAVRGHVSGHGRAGCYVRSVANGHRRNQLAV